MTRKTQLEDVPASACQLRGDFIKLELQPAAEGKKRRTFKMLAYTGKVVNIGWWGPWIADLSGMTIAPKLPVLMDHNPRERIGFTESAKITKTGIEATGVFLTNEDAMAVLQDLDDGFPMQVSIGVDHEAVERVFEGETAEVNGETVEGPCVVARKTVLREMSMLSIGADNETAAVAAAGDVAATVKVAITSEDHMSKETEKPGGTPPATLTAAQVREAHPTQVAELSASAAAGAAQAAVAAERDRVQAILAAADPSQGDLAQVLVKDGTSASDALAKLNADLKVKLAAAKTATLGGKQTTNSLAGGNGGTEADPADPKGELRAAFPDDERGQKAYAAYLKRQKDKAGAAT